MTILNIHSREFDSTKEQVGALLDSLSAPNDRLWPHSRWPAMKFDRVLSVGARGGHGPVRYEVVEYLPGKKVRFQFNATRGPCVGLNGHHWFEIEPSANGKILLKHSLQGECVGGMKLRWSLVFRPLHDALIEDALDCAETELMGAVKSPAKWGFNVILLRRLVRLFSRRREKLL